MPPPLPPLVLTTLDHERLTALVAGLPPGHPVAEPLAAELDRADIVEPHDLPPDVVTMNSRVVIEDVDSGERREVTLVYPAAADFAAGRLSVSAPVGAALIGLRAGATIPWVMPDGRTRQVRAVQVTWQPEAAGDPTR